MKTLLFAMAFALAIAHAAAAESYSARWDNVKVEDILRSDRLRQPYVKCLLDQGPCSKEAAALKSVLPDALATQCAKCTDRQRQGAQVTLRFFIDNKPEEWKRLEAKYDPTGKYRRTYEESKKKSG